MALRLGKTLTELEQTMPAREFFLWAGFDRLSPIGDDRFDILSAQQSAAIYTAAGIKTSVKDLVIKWNESSDSSENLEMSEQEVIAGLLRLCQH